MTPDRFAELWADAEIERLCTNNAELKAALQIADHALMKYLSHQLGHQESYRVLQHARDTIRAALTKAEEQK